MQPSTSMAVLLHGASAQPATATAAAATATAGVAWSLQNAGPVSTVGRLRHPHTCHFSTCLQHIHNIHPLNKEIFTGPD